MKILSKVPAPKMVDREVDHTEVFFLGEDHGWAFSQFNEAGHQLGSAVFFFHRSDAIAYARTFAADRPCHVYKRDGSLNFVKGGR